MFRRVPISVLYFFLIFINDICSDINYAKCLLFADDLKIYLVIKSINDCILLQRDLDAIFSWSIRNKLLFNVSKCVSLRFCRSKNRIWYDYSMDGKILKSVKTHTDLGITFDEKLTFTVHASTIANEAYRTLGFIIRNSSSFSNFNTLKTLFFSFVRCKLEYASVIWNLHQASYVLEIEKIQKRFLRYAYYKKFGSYPSWEISYKYLLKLFNFISLEDRRKIRDVTWLHKLVNSLIDNSNILSQLNFFAPPRNTRHRVTFYNNQPRLTATSFSPLYRTTNLYNKLAATINIDFSMRPPLLRKFLLNSFSTHTF